MADTIALRGLRVRGHHGVLAPERQQGQDFLVDAVLSVDTHAAAASDHVGDTVDYGVLAERLASIVAGPPVDLLETLASRLADECLSHALVSAVELTVHKPQAPISIPFDDAAVTVRRSRPGPVVLALGSNLGDRLAHLRAAALALRRLAPLRASGVWETEAVGGPEQGRYLNAVVTLAPAPALPTDPLALLDLVQALELMRDRERRERWGPRTLDIDILAVGPGTLVTERLELPHPRAATRPFVLLPWLEVEPDAVFPGGGRIDQLAPNLDSAGVVRTDLPLLPEA